MQEQKEIACYTDYNIQMSDLCSELSFFVIFDFPFSQMTPESMSKKPTIVTYRNDDISFKEIRSRYLRLNTGPAKLHKIRFTLSKGYTIATKSTVKDLKKALRRDNLDGVLMFVYEVEDEDNSDEEQYEGDFINECGLMDYISMEQSFNKQKDFTFHFLLPSTKFVISIKIDPSLKVAALIQNFYKEVVKEFQLNLDKEDVKQFKIKDTSTVLVHNKDITKHTNLFDDSQIEVILQNKNIQFTKKMAEEHIITFIKEEIDPKGIKKSSKTQKLNYELIKNMQVSKINSQYFLEKGQKENKYNPICLKVMQIIIKGEQKLRKLDDAIKKLKKLGDVKLVAFFINEKIIFYKEIPQILKEKDAREFTLEQLDIPSEESDVRSKCDKLINERLGTIQQDYFRNKQHVEPIFVYTSNLKYKDKKTGSVTKIYDSLNKCLRTESVLTKQPAELSQEWVYRYTSTLLKHLQNIGGEQCTVYRGVDYDPQGTEGDQITFKPFTSTSKSETIALNFALQSYATDPKRPLTLFQMKILSGKPIHKLSYFSTEQELLLEPFTEFLITKIERNVIKRIPDIEEGTPFNFTIYKLQEINSPKEMPKTINNYILWIDDKPNEGKQTFRIYIEEFYYTTVFFQISSTQELQKWIKQRQSIINDDSSKIIMVTNMVRTENNVKNFYAGVQSINLIRQTIPNIPIAVYVRDINASNNNLNERNVPRQNLVVINQFQQLAEFAQAHTKLKFKRIVPNQPEPLVSQTAQAAFTKPEQNSIPTTNKKPKSTTSSKGGEKGSCQIM